MIDAGRQRWMIGCLLQGCRQAKRGRNCDAVAIGESAADTPPRAQSCLATVPPHHLSKLNGIMQYVIQSSHGANLLSFTQSSCPNPTYNSFSPSPSAYSSP